jgi:hypothetical protein
VDDNPKPDEGQQEHQPAPGSVSEPLLQRIAVAIEAQTKTAENKTQSGSEPAKPLFVQEVGGDDLEPFEEQTLAISKRTYWIALFGFGAAVVAAVFVGSQVKIMSDQTQIMGAQSESAVAGAIENERNTRKQLAIAQQQATAAQDNVKAITRQMRQDQRAWIKLDMPDKVHFEAYKTVEISVRVTNIGKTVARNVRVDVVIQKLPVNKAPSLTFDKAIESTTTVGVEYPNDPEPMFARWYLESGNLGILSIDDIQDKVIGKIYFVFYARARYVDIFGTKHVTTFCERSITPVPTFSRTCSDFNGTDNN